MFLRENYTAEHIADMRKKTGADPSILERTVFAFGLLEAIRRVGLPCIFMGGTSLLILLKQPRRLSTDIDIIVAPGTDVDAYIEKAGRVFPFLKAANEVYAETSATNPHFKKMYEAMAAFRSDQYTWWQVAEYGFDSFQIRSRTRT